MAIAGPTNEVIRKYFGVRGCRGVGGGRGSAVSLGARLAAGFSHSAPAVNGEAAPAPLHVPHDDVFTPALGVLQRPRCRRGAPLVVFRGVRRGVERQEPAPSSVEWEHGCFPLRRARQGRHVTTYEARCPSWSVVHRYFSQHGCF